MFKIGVAAFNNFKPFMVKIARAKLLFENLYVPYMAICYRPI